MLVKPGQIHLCCHVTRSRSMPLPHFPLLFGSDIKLAPHPILVPIIPLTPYLDDNLEFDLILA